MHPNTWDNAMRTIKCSASHATHIMVLQFECNFHLKHEDTTENSWKIELKCVYFGAKIFEIHT